MMRYVPLLLVVLSAVTLQAQRQPWEWTDEERLAVRYDAKSVAERAAAAAADPHGPRFHSQKAGPQPLAKKTMQVIVGDRNPELFMPYELFDTFLAGGFVQNDPSLFRQEIDERGAYLELPADFWPVMQEITKTFVTSRREQMRLGRTLNGPDDPRQAEVQAAIKRLQAGDCAARADALAEARRRFGRTVIDRLLYELMAPGSLHFSDDPFPPARLLEIARGCR
jgi:hypothetical protein